MEIIYSEHAKKRMKQRDIEDWEIEHIINHLSYTKKSSDGTIVAVGEIKDKKLKIIYTKEENYIKVISV